MMNVLEELEQEEQIESLQYLVHKLPEFVSAIRVMEDKLTFLVDSLNDQKSLRLLVEETEEKVDNLNIHKEHLDAMVELVQMLPRFLPAIKKVEDMTLFIESVVGDEKTVNTLIEGFNDIVPVKEGAEIIEETNQHFEENEDTSTVSVFGLMRMIKDPTVQTGIKYAQSLLTVINQRKS